MDSKLKCVFVMPDNNSVTSNGAAPSVDHAKQDYHSVSSSVSAPPNKPSMAASSSPKVNKQLTMFVNKFVKSWKINFLIGKALMLRSSTHILISFQGNMILKEQNLI